MRQFTAPRRSPSIRSPSLLEQSSFPPSSSSNPSFPTSTYLTPNPLSLRFVRILQGLIVLLVGWYEYGTFYYHSNNCFIQTQTSTTSNNDEEEGFKVLIVTDPQLLDMSKSYPDRNWLLKWLSIEFTNKFMKKSWNFLTTSSSRSSNIGMVVWNGDLLDNGREMTTNDEYTSYTRLFHKLFPLPRQIPKSSSSSSSSSSRHLDPPVPVIYVPGNHDLPLHPSSSINSTDRLNSSSHFLSSRKQFRDSFGPLWGEREFKGFNLIWIDSIALIEQAFWENNNNDDDDYDKDNDNSDVGSFREMKEWLEDLGKGPVTVPRILFTHIPLYRPPSTFCGPHRESKNWNGGIRDGYGKGYQNLIGKSETDWLMKRIRPEKVFSGDDHDYCFIEHPYVSSINETQKITETTVKSFSMAMGISHPGYSFLTLHPPSTSSLPPTFTEQSCTLPSQLGIYLHIYIPLSITLFLFFFVPKLIRASKNYIKRFRRKLRQRKKLKLKKNKNNLLRWKFGGARRTSGGSRGGGEEKNNNDVDDEDGLFPTTTPDISSNEEGYYGYSANLGGAGADDDDPEPISNRPSPLRREIEQEEDDTTSTSDEEEEDYDGMKRGGGGRRPSKVRRVSRVWLWEKNNSTLSSSSLLSSPRLSTTSTTLPRYSTYEDDQDDHNDRLIYRLKNVVYGILNRLSQNTLLIPLLRLARPIVRLVRTVLFITLGKPLGWIAKSLGGRKGFARALSESIKDFWRVTWMGILLWLIVWVWV